MEAPVAAARALRVDAEGATAREVLLGDLPDARETAVPADGAGALALPATDADAAATASGTAAPSIGGSTVLTGARSARIEQLLTDLEAIAEVRGDGSSYRADVREAARQLASTRYRTAPREWLSAIGTLQRQARGSRRAVGISSGEVNFFADSGRLQPAACDGAESLDSLVTCKPRDSAA